MCGKEQSDMAQAGAPLPLAKRTTQPSETLTADELAALSTAAEGGCAGDTGTGIISDGIGRKRAKTSTRLAKWLSARGRTTPRAAGVHTARQGKAWA
jgi:hypothetical protein